MITRLRSGVDDVRIAQLLERATGSGDAQAGQYAREVLARVSSDGVEAVLEYARDLDGADAASLDDLYVAPEQLQAAWDSLDGVVRDALTLARDRIDVFHRHQLQDDWAFEDALGVRLAQRARPLRRVGLYVPGGRAAYPSTVLMNAIPAQVAGVAELVVTTPAARPKDIAPAVLGAAHLAGVDCVYALGGAHAVAALGYGCAGLDAVDKICGPGNRYVTAAKQQMYGRVGVDSLAGPTEVAIVADTSLPPRWAALDMCAQAEHDPDARAVLFCADDAHIERIAAALEEELASMPRAEIIADALLRNGALIAVSDAEDALRWCNRMAPEHLQLAVAEPDALLAQVECAGAVFMGVHASEALGDYLAGSNHVLPTMGTARFASALGVGDFVRRTSVIGCGDSAAAQLAAPAALLARLEGLEAHARSAEARAEPKK